MVLVGGLLDLSYWLAYLVAAAMYQSAVHCPDFIYRYLPLVHMRTELAIMSADPVTKLLFPLLS